MKKVKLYVEGGGDSNQLRTMCRKGFREFLEKTEVRRRMPQIIACGGRSAAFDDFCTAIANPEPDVIPVLLVDAEMSVSSGSPWEHVAQRSGDGWRKPARADDSHLYFMAQCMESWFLADVSALKGFYKKYFKATAIPSQPQKNGILQVETISKGKVFDCLAKATAQCNSGKYSKSRHSFQILAIVDPQRVQRASLQAKRLIDFLAGVAATDDAR